MRKRQEQSASFRDALWVSRCVGHAETTPLRLEDVEGLARFIEVRNLVAGEPLQRLGEVPTAVCIVRDGCLEIAVHGSGGRMVIQTLRAGDIDGDIQILLGMPMPYETRANTETTCLMLSRSHFASSSPPTPSLTTVADKRVAASGALPLPADEFARGAA